MKNMTTFPKRLLELRKQHNMTQRDVASYLSIAQPSYIRYENGTAEPTLDNLARLADLFDVEGEGILHAIAERHGNGDFPRAEHGQHETPLRGGGVDVLFQTDELHALFGQL